MTAFNVDIFSVSPGLSYFDYNTTLLNTCLQSRNINKIHIRVSRSQPGSQHSSFSGVTRSGGSFTPPLPRALSNTLMKMSNRESCRSPLVIFTFEILSAFTLIDQFDFPFRVIKRRRAFYSNACPPLERMSETLNPTRPSQVPR